MTIAAGSSRDTRPAASMMSIDPLTKEAAFHGAKGHVLTPALHRRRVNALCHH